MRLKPLFIATLGAVSVSFASCSPVAQDTQDSQQEPASASAFADVYYDDATSLSALADPDSASILAPAPSPGIS